MTNKHGDLKTTRESGKIPNLFIVGAPKCGTTSLHYWLSQHPEIFMSDPKEPFYFCKDLHEEADNLHGYKVNYFKYRDEESYLQIFQNAKNEKIRVKFNSIRIIPGFGLIFSIILWPYPGGDDQKHC